MVTKFKNYTELWKYTFPEHYKEKYEHPCGMTGGGGEFPFYDIHVKQEVVLLPEYKFILASSVELFNVPDDWYLVTKNKSSIARLGIDATFNTVIDNGFKGYLTIEIVNTRPVTQTLQAGQPIMKVIPQRIDFPCGIYDGKYQNQPDKPVDAIVNRPRNGLPYCF